MKSEEQKIQEWRNSQLEDWDSIHDWEVMCG